MIGRFIIRYRDIDSAPDGVPRGLYHIEVVAQGQTEDHARRAAWRRMSNEGDLEDHLWRFDGARRLTTRERLHPEFRCGIRRWKGRW